jgi:anhydro-N-acetylmuramic acid kinase
MLSGTSRDGVDAVLVSFEDYKPRLYGSICLPYPPDLAAPLKTMIESGKRPSTKDLEMADDQLAVFFSHAVQTLLAKAGIGASSVAAIGSHGQTVWHDPNGGHPETIQLGNPQVLAQNTGITTVGDFRSRDIRAGGQGAPLAPLLHRTLFQPEKGKRVVLNLGGIANISVVYSDGTVTGFDTGPANCLLDAWIQDQLGEPFDQAGAWSGGGAVNKLLLLDLMMDPYFRKPPPKSTGVEYFNLNWLKNRAMVNAIDPRDVQATLAQLTASTVASSVSAYNPVDVLVCGGGAHNENLLSRLKNLLPDCTVESTASHGIDPDCVEAVLFAWLARERIAGRFQDTGSITGAREPVLLGEIFKPGPVPNSDG